MEDQRKYYNEERPHGAIGSKPLNHDARASETSSFRRSKEWSQSKSTRDPIHRWMKVGAQVNAVEARRSER
jgi:hypothetical protein